MHVLIESPSSLRPDRTIFTCECGILFGVLDNFLLPIPDSQALTDVLWRHRQHVLLQIQQQEDAEVLMWDKEEAAKQG